MTPATAAPAMDLAQMLPRAVRQAFVEARRAEAFHSTITLPKSCNRYLVAGAIDRLVYQKQSETEALEGKGLLKAEKQYVLDVVAEFRAWQVERETTRKATVEAALAPEVE